MDIESAPSARVKPDPFWTAEIIGAFRTLTESAVNGVVCINTEGSIRVFNPAARRIIGLEAKEVLDRSIREVLPSVWEEMKEILTNGNPQIARRLSLGEKTIVTNRTPIFARAQLIGVLSVFQDFSDYEAMATRLAAFRRLNEELDVILNSSYDGLWICDHQGRVMRVNRASEKMSGVREADVVGRAMQDLVQEGIFDKSATLEVLKNKTAVTLIQKLKDGRHILVTGNPVLDEAGQIRLVVVNARDISELNRLHAELETSRALTHHYRSKLDQMHRMQQAGGDIVVRSPAMQKVVETAMRVAEVDSSILLNGESGVGKGLVAEMIHEASARQKGSLIRINCGAIPESLIEAELFGYEKGAFTGARADGKPGYFELAEAGTLFLDEVGELPLNVQVKLLRFLESNEVTRVGATVPRKIDVRIIAATNRDLEAMVSEGGFRRDLFFRLNVVPIGIPPLRERIDDIPPLIHLFLNRFNEKYCMKKTLLPSVVDAMCRHRFPGNVRELQNLVERLVVLSPGEAIGPEHLPDAIQAAGSKNACDFADDTWHLKTATQTVERRLICRALQETASQREAAKRLGVDHSTLSRKIHRLKISTVEILQRGA
jgi:PAS domain S-box-containing protein